MKYIFDTHAFIWWDSEPASLSNKVLSICQDPNNTLIFSVVSAWEMQIKAQLGKLSLSLPLEQMISGQQNTNQIQVLSCNLGHMLALDSLPFHHKDPFDRLLIAQANVENAILLSKDHIMSKYQVNVTW